MKCKSCKNDALPNRKKCDPCAEKDRQYNAKRYAAETPEQKAARLENHREWYRSNVERVMAYDLARREEDPERSREACRDWYARNRESVLPGARERSKQRYAANAAILIEQARLYHAAHPEIAQAAKRKYRATHRAELYAAHAERLNVKRAGSLTADEWLETCAEFGNRCAYCLRDDVKLSLDHVWPLAHGGGHERDNVVPACISCNSSKNDRIVFDWLIATNGVGSLARKAA